MAKWVRKTKIATAGQAEIWLVVNRETEQQAVMKKLFKAAQLTDPEKEMRRFQREVRCQSAMDHPGIMPIIGHNFEADPPFYLMPVADRTLDDLLKENPGGLSEDLASEIFLQVAEALAYAHEQGVLHRDIKPRNILQTDGAWQLADFGLCRDLASDSTTFTQANSVVGTVAYMAPEQFDDGHAVTETADVFGLGRVFFQMLTGKVPFPYMPLDELPHKLKYVISKATAPNPSDRYLTVAEFARQVEQLTQHSDALTAPLERAKELLSALLDGQDSATPALLELILANSDDEVFFTDFVARLPSPALAALQMQNVTAFESVVSTFDSYSEGGHPFNYVDVIADFFASVFDISTNPLIRQLALNRIMVVGEDHNRFYVRTLFGKIVGKLKDPHDIVLAVNVMRGDSKVANWYKAELTAYSLPTEIKDVLNELPA